MDNDKKAIIIALIAAVLLIAPTIIRMLNHDPYMPNSDAYHNTRIYSHESFNYDSLQARSIEVNIINLIPHSWSGANGYLLFNIIPILLGMASVYLMYLVLKKHNISEKTVFAVLLLMIFSPIFIYVFTDFKIYSFIIFLNILGVYLLGEKNILYSSIAFGIIPFIDLYSGIITIAMLSLYYFSNEKKNEAYFTTGMVMLTAILISIVINLYFGYNVLHIFRFESQNFITDIGADIGFSFSILILAAIGLVMLWENGLKNIMIYIMLILLIAISFFNAPLRIYINFILVIYAGFALIYLNKRKWSIAIIKKTTVLLIICSILFSTLVYATRLVKSEPDSQMVDALQFVKQQSLPTETIMSLPKYGYIIEYYANRQAFIDTDTSYYDSWREEIYENITTSRNLDRTQKALEEYNIRYFVVDKDFQSYLNEKEGLLFLIENSQKFINIYNSTDVQVWMYTG